MKNLTLEQNLVISILGNYRDTYSEAMPAGGLEREAKRNKIKEPRFIIRKLLKAPYRYIRGFPIDEPKSSWDDLPAGIRDGHDSGYESAYLTGFRFELNEKGLSLYESIAELEVINSFDGNPKAPKGLFEFKPGVVLFNGEITDITKDDSRIVLENLCDHPGEVLRFKELLPNELKQEIAKQAEQPLKDAIHHLRDKLKKYGITIKNHRGTGYRISGDYDLKTTGKPEEG